MSRIILGTVQFGLKYGINNYLGQPDQFSVYKIFDKAQEIKISTLDTAYAYGCAHAIIGKYHSLRNSKFKINTKFSSVNPELFIKQVANACVILGTDYIDTCFYHSFQEFKNQSLKSYYNELLTKGLIKNIGVSIYTNEEFETVINDPSVNVIQIPFNLFDNFSQRGELILKAKAVGKTIQVRSIFLQGLFFMKPDALKGNTVGLKEELVILKNIAKDFNITISDLCIRYAFHYKEIDNIIIGVDTAEQLQSNINSSRNIISSEVIDCINKIQVKNTSLLYPYNWK